MFLFYASFLISLVYSSIPSADIFTLSAATKVAFYDFDKTSTIKSFGAVVRDICNATALAADPDSACGDGAEDMVTALDTLNDTVLRDAFGGDDRIDRLKLHWDRITSDESSIENIFILSTSWYPAPAAQWKDMIIDTFSRIPEFDGFFNDNNVLTLDDPGPGISADKGAVAKIKLDALGLTSDQCINIDDSQGNIDSEAGTCSEAWDPPNCVDRARTCDTLQVIPRAGMSAVDLNYVVARGILPHECIVPFSTTEDNDSGVATYKNVFLYFFVFVFCAFMFK